jgi:putative endonuclease
MPDSGNPPAGSKPWFVYLVRALNSALYCGISDDPFKRFAKHQSGKGARFFRSSPAVALVYIERVATKGGALSRERAIKQLSKQQKELLIRTQECMPASHLSNDAGECDAGSLDPIARADVKGVALAGSPVAPLTSSVSPLSLSGA